jgi:hypothetical protein
MSIQRLSNAGQSGFRYKSLIAGITPVASVPVIGEATAVTYSTASVTFTAPGAYAATTFTATSSPGGLTGTSASSPITVSGLSGTTSYTFTVTATNASGTSSPSAASNSITTPAEWSPEGAYDSLATVTVPSGGVASVAFAGIPTGYKHLQIRFLARCSRTDYTVAAVFARFNGDTATNYSSHYIGADGSTAFVYGGANYTFAAAGLASGANSGASIFSGGVLDILDYQDTNKYKTTKVFSGFSRNTTSDEVNFQSGNWRNTSAITSINFTLETGANFLEYSQFALYGVK